LAIIQFFTINTIAELTCFMVALFCLWKDSSRIWRSMIFFQLITCLAELTGIYFKKIFIANHFHGHSNPWIYNILLIFQAIFFSLVFNQILSKYKNCRPVILTSLAVLALFYTYESFNHGIYEYNNITNTIMAVLLVCYSLFYFFNLLKDDTYVNLFYLPTFWWVTGILFFYFGDTACNLFYEKLKPILMVHKHYLRNIYSILNVILYSCWSYSFICRKWLAKKSEIL